MAVIRRLPRYYRYLHEMYLSGIKQISSRDLADCMKLTPSQVRQDFNCFGDFGQQGCGYDVVQLHDENSTGTEADAMTRWFDGGERFSNLRLEKEKDSGRAVLGKSGVIVAHIAGGGGFGDVGGELVQVWGVQGAADLAGHVVGDADMLGGEDAVVIVEEEIAGQRHFVAGVADGTGIEQETALMREHEGVMRVAHDGDVVEIDF